MKLLQLHNNSIQNYILQNNETFTSFGSEFRSPDLLEPLLMHHPNWHRFRLLLLEGSHWALAPLPNENRLEKNNEFIKRGNHKSAIKYETELQKIITQEVSQGWMLPLPLHYINKLAHGEIAPVGIEDSQWSELPDGSRKIKFRLTHDQSFEASVGLAVNTRVIHDSLEPLYYGGCLSRLIHYIISVRYRHPKTKILGGKSDFKGAYRRIHLQGDTAEKCTIMYKEFGLPSLRLTFGGSPCPNEFCIVSELCTDLANDLLHCPYWDPTENKSPYLHLLSSPKLLDDSIPFGQAKELDVDIPPDDYGRVDDFIDDGIVIVPDIGDNRNRAVPALILAIHTICRPLDKKEPITREDCLSLSKLNEEGTLAENLIILGWEINTRLLTLALPKKKFKIWSRDLKAVLTSKKISYKKLETIVGRLNHTATACPLMRYYLNRIRNVLIKWNKMSIAKNCERYLSKTVLEDLQLWTNHFLPKVNQGISLNMISFRRPSYLCWSDACPQGLGGYDHKGNAWRFQIPESARQSVLLQNNSLEFVASLISVWVAIAKNYAEKETCFLALGDNSSAVGWLHKSNVDESTNLPLHIAARKYAEILLEADCCLYSQHIKGISNNVADSLSRRFDLSDDALSNFIRLSYPSQVPNSFKISPLPPDLSSWVTYWLQKCKEKTELQKTRETKRLEFGDDGWSTLKSSSLSTTSGSKTSHQKEEPKSWEPLHQPYEEDNFLARTKETWQQEQSKRPWQNWVRCLGQTWGTTPHMVWDHTASTPPSHDSSKV
jgi:hypothetical protein